MAIKRAEKKVDDVEKNIEVANVKEWSDNNITFTLIVNGVSIYGCRIVEGKNGDFVSFPSRKGNDGKYYAHAYIKLSTQDVDTIESLISTML